MPALSTKEHSSKYQISLLDDTYMGYFIIETTDDFIKSLIFKIRNIAASKFPFQIYIKKTIEKQYMCVNYYKKHL